MTIWSAPTRCSGPGGDAAVVRVHGTDKALAISDRRARRAIASPIPVEGGKQAIAECYRNLCAVGATPLAVTDCMNFGNPQRPEIMGQFVGCIEGMAEACRALDFPIVSRQCLALQRDQEDDGSGSAILPTPAIGGVGLLAGLAQVGDDRVQGRRRGDLPASATRTAISASRCGCARCHGREEGPPPPVDLAGERGAGELVRRLIADGLVTAVHDCRRWRPAVALAEMALAGGIGATVTGPGARRHSLPVLFGEDQGRYVVTTTDASRSAWTRQRPRQVFAASDWRHRRRCARHRAPGTHLASRSPTCAARMRTSSPA